MQTIHTLSATKNLVRQWKHQGLSIGLVPTMGFLHKGHASLIQKAREQNDIVIVSIFVNPLQFGPQEDLQNYPRDLEHDAALCESLGVDMIFAPTPEEMYGDTRKTFITVEDLGLNLCGKTRPLHFRGVCTVVAKLFNITGATRAYFGQKDAQQLAIIRKMVKDLNFDIEIVPCPLLREADGLALSSRNTYLDATQRQAALCLSRSIRYGQDHIHAQQDAAELLAAMRAIIEAETLARIDYVSVVDAETMEDVAVIDRPVLVAMAVYIGKVRLIDNFSFDPQEHEEQVCHQ